MYYTNLDVREHNAQNEISRHQVRVSGSIVDVKPEVNLSADSYDVTVWPIEWAVLHHRWQERSARASKVRDQGAMTPASTMSEPRGP
ncbi:MAG TPA: hypothetical protein DCM87_19795 [Planctomycetes bacterium]|nr:hypothetical protein [Planctomycetota bacterium]